MNLVCSYLQIPIGLLSSVVLASFCVQAQVADAKSKRTFTHDRDVETAYTWRHIPRWNGERLVGYDNNHSRGIVIYTVDRDGRHDETVFTLKDGAQINVVDVAGSQDGEIAIIASAYTTDTPFSTFLARIAADGQHQLITPTWPYRPGVVTFAPDGSVWTIGHLKDYENTRVLENNVLRRFDRTGKMLGSTTLQVRGWQSAVTSYLRASRDRVGWFTLGGEYIEFSLDGSEIGRYEQPEGATERNISGVDISEDNDVIAGRFGNGKAELVLLDRDKRTWTAVALPKEYAPTWAWVLGFDGTTLVTYSRSGLLRRFKTK